MNAAELKDFQSRDQFLAHAALLPRIILEGATDRDLFRVWFEKLYPEVEFLAAEDLGRGGGCTAVQPAVELSRDQKIPVLGIVDRDWLHRERRWETMFSPDGRALDDVSGDPDVRVAALWEIEAYLLHPELLSTWVGVQRSPQPVPDDEPRTALARALEECEALLCAASFFGSAHATRVSYDLKHFCGNPSAHVAEVCRKELAGAPEERQKIATEIDGHMEAVRAAAPADPAERLVYYLRYVDTKRLLHRLVARLKLNKEAHHALKHLMADRKLRPDELERFLTEADEKFKSLEA